MTQAQPISRLWPKTDSGAADPGRKGQLGAMATVARFRHGWQWVLAVVVFCRSIEVLSLDLSAFWSSNSDLFCVLLFFQFASSSSLLVDSAKPDIFLSNSRRIEC